MATVQVGRVRENALIAVIGDEDTITGFLLAGVGDVNSKRQANFTMVDKTTTVAQIEEAFRNYTTRDDVSIVLINQHIANDIRPLLDSYFKAIPSVLEIPSKDHPYDASKDSILRRAKMIFGGEV